MDWLTTVFSDDKLRYLLVLPLCPLLALFVPMILAAACPVTLFILLVMHLDEKTLSPDSDFEGNYRVYLYIYPGFWLCLCLNLGILISVVAIPLGFTVAPFLGIWCFYDKRSWFNREA